MRKPAFCICKSKDTDQLHGYHEADQRLSFRYIASTIPLLPKYKISSFWMSSVAVQPGSCETWSEILKTGFLTLSPILCGEFLETEEELNYLCSENKGADQLRGDTVQLICAFVFTLCKKHVFSQCGSYEQHHKKTCFCKCENKDADQLCDNWAADQRLCFRYIDLLIEKVEGLYYDDNSTTSTFSTSNHLLWLYISKSRPEEKISCVFDDN